MKFMNKRGDKYLSVYWFVVLAIVAGGIVGMVYVYYGSPYDIREIESNVLWSNIADCVSYAGKINMGFISNSQPHQKTEDVFLEECHLNFTSSEGEEQYFTEVSFYKLSDLNNSVLNLKAGNKNYPASCSIQENKKQDNLPQCTTKSFYSVDDLNNQYIIKILTAVGKSEKNVKL